MVVKVDRAPGKNREDRQYSCDASGVATVHRLQKLRHAQLKKMHQAFRLWFMDGVTIIKFNAINRENYLFL